MKKNSVLRTCLTLSLKLNIDVNSLEHCSFFLSLQGKKIVPHLKLKLFFKSFYQRRCRRFFPRDLLTP